MSGLVTGASTGPHTQTYSDEMRSNTMFRLAEELSAASFVDCGARYSALKSVPHTAMVIQYKR